MKEKEQTRTGTERAAILLLTLGEQEAARLKAKRQNPVPVLEGHVEIRETVLKQIRE